MKFKKIFAEVAIPIVVLVYASGMGIQSILKTKWSRIGWAIYSAVVVVLVAFAILLGAAYSIKNPMGTKP